VATARASGQVEIGPEAAYAAWVDLSRWPAFIDGFGRVEHADESWPAVGAELVWVSLPSGRGRVHETVVACKPGALLETRVREEQLEGTQTVSFERSGDGARVGLELAYRLSGGGPLRFLVDLLFVRRAEGEALDRTLGRFAVEAAQEAAL
jgi:Polyketide cyclase / dehydrase and lipid transport